MQLLKEKDSILASYKFCGETQAMETGYELPQDLLAALRYYREERLFLLENE